VTSYLLSWLRKRFAGSDLATFEKLHPHDWLVWEPGAWHPPERSGHTLVAGAAVARPPGAGAGAGEALAVALSRDGRRPYVTLGRGPENDVVIDDATLSRVHLVLMRAADGSWTLRDAGSSNGSRLAGQRLEPGKPLPLPTGTRIEAGSVRLTFHGPADLLRRLQAPG
jgi:pSer/pThr/pTyr-binding forkhead associated (FHA) protein